MTIPQPLGECPGETPRSGGEEGVGERLHRHTIAMQQMQVAALIRRRARTLSKKLRAANESVSKRSAA